MKRFIALFVFIAGGLSHVTFLSADSNRDFSKLNSAQTIQDVKTVYGEPDYQVTVFKDGVNNTSLAYNLDQETSQEIEFADGKLASSEVTQFYFLKNEQGEQLIKENGKVQKISEKLVDGLGLNEVASSVESVAETKYLGKSFNELADYWKKEGFNDQQRIMLLVQEARRRDKMSGDDLVRLEQERGNIDMKAFNLLKSEGFTADQIMDIALMHNAIGTPKQGQTHQSGPSFAESLGNAMSALGNTSNIQRRKSYTYYDRQGGAIGSVREDY